MVTLAGINPSDSSEPVKKPSSTNNRAKAQDISFYSGTEEAGNVSDKAEISTKYSYNVNTNVYTKPVELHLTDANKNKVIKGNLPSNIPAIRMGGVIHYAYSDCPSADRITIDGYTVHKDIKEPWRRMKEAAKADGIDLNIVSGFRAISRQKSIFPKKFKPGIVPSDERFISRLKESAPPGFSEHHTGYAIDICSVEESDFEKGGRYYKVGVWLKKHAKEFGFEQSFPENNSQGLINEPWHYRYVGDKRAQETFAAVHQVDSRDNYFAKN